MTKRTIASSPRTIETIAVKRETSPKGRPHRRCGPENLGVPGAFIAFRIQVPESRGDGVNHSFDSPKKFLCNDCRHLTRARQDLFGGSSHPRALPVDAIPAEFFLFVGLFDFRRRHDCGEGQRQRVSVVGRRLVGPGRGCCVPSEWRPSLPAYHTNK
jgi:hypothetical protein